METTLDTTEVIQAKNDNLPPQIDTIDSNQSESKRQESDSEEKLQVDAQSSLSHGTHEGELDETHSNDTYVSEEAHLDKLYGELQENKDTKVGATKYVVEDAYALIAETSSIEENMMDDSNYSAEIDDLQEQIQALTLELKDSREKMEKQTQEIHKFSQHNIQITKELEEAIMKANDLEKDLNDTRATMAMTTNVITTNEDMQPNQKLSQEQGYYEKEFEDMKQNYITEKKLKEESLQQLSDLKEKLSLADQEKQSAEDVLSQVSREKDDMQQKLSVFESENQDLRKELTSSEKLKEDMERKISENKKLQEEIRQECSTLQKQNEDITQTFTSMEIKYNDMLQNKETSEEEQGKSIHKLQLDIDTLEKDKEDALRQINLLQSEKDKVIQNAELADKAKAEALDQLVNIEKVKDETLQQLADAKQDTQDLLQKVKAAEDSKEEFENQVTQLLAEKDDLQQELTLLKSEKEILNKKLIENEELKTAMSETASEEKRSKEETMQKLQITEESNNELKLEVTKLENENANLQKQLSRIDAASNNEVDFMDEDEMKKYLRLTNMTRRLLEKSGVDPIAYKLGFQKKVLRSETLDEPKPSPTAQKPSLHHGHFNVNDLVEYFDNRVVDIFGKEEIASYLAEELIDHHELIAQREEINNDNNSENDVTDDEWENLRTKIEAKKERVMKLSKMLGITGDEHVYDQNFVNDKSPEKASLWESKKKSFLNDSRFKSLNLEFTPLTSAQAASRVLFGVLIRERRRNNNEPKQKTTVEEMLNNFNEEKTSEESSVEGAIEPVDLNKEFKLTEDNNFKFVSKVKMKKNDVFRRLTNPRNYTGIQKQKKLTAEKCKQEKLEGMAKKKVKPPLTPVSANKPIPPVFERLYNHQIRHVVSSPTDVTDASVGSFDSQFSLYNHRKNEKVLKSSSRNWVLNYSKKNVFERLQENTTTAYRESKYMNQKQ